MLEAEDGARDDLDDMDPLPGPSESLLEDAMAAALADASQFESQGNFREAFRSYREAITWATQVFDVVVHVVESDDYLSQLALDYNSTVSLIAAANNLANPNIIIPGQELLIPILP